MRKFVIYAFNGDPNCFLHVLLTVLDMADKGHEVRLVIEGSAIRLTENPEEHGTIFADLYNRVQELGLVDRVHLTCLVGAGGGADVQGQPSMTDYLRQGYEVITF